ncbi:MAG TPA: ATP-binding protein [Longimicrobiales bacterium]|nr:ATP-binding protein [Longimicrobiales bacterium]
MKRTAVVWGRVRPWLPALGLGTMAGLSLLIVELDHRQGVATFEATTMALDNLTRARLAVADAAVAWEAVRGGDTTRDPSEEVARLTEAVGALEDLVDGRSALVAFRGRSPVDDPSPAAWIRAYTEEVSAARDAAVAGVSASDPVAHRLRLRKLMVAAVELEHQVHRTVEAELLAKRRRHHILLGAWGGFLALVLAGFAALRAARGRERAARGRAEERSGVAERRYVALELVAAVGVLRVDGQGTVRETTEWWSRTMGSGKDDSVGTPWWTLLPEGDRDGCEAFWRERAALGVAFSQDARLMDGEGTRRWLTGRWEPSQPEGQGGAVWVGAFLDVTEQRAVEAQFHQAQRLEAVGRLTGKLAHDFNNLLSVILTNTHLLLMDGDRLGEEEKEMLDDVDRAAKSGRDLVKRLMDFTRRSELTLTEVDLASTARQAAELARKLLLSDVTLDLALPEPGPAVHADARAIEQILLNLVTNARDAMPGGGIIRIAVDEVEADAELRGERPSVAPGRYGRITVSDEGTGMDEATLEQAFEPFFTTKTQGKGTGLGLSTVHGLMRQHGGHVRVSSQGGQGTTFRLYFPVAASEQARPPGSAEAGHAAERHPVRSLRILVVEDDASLRRTSARMLGRLGYRVVEAGGVAEALEILGDPGTRVDVILSDLSTPGMDDRELHRRLREGGDVRPFIFTSGLSRRDMAERGALPAGTYFLPKPWSANQLLDLMGSLEPRAG